MGKYLKIKDQLVKLEGDEKNQLALLSSALEGDEKNHLTLLSTVLDRIFWHDYLDEKNITDKKNVENLRYDLIKTIAEAQAMCEQIISKKEARKNMLELSKCNIGERHETHKKSH